MTTISPGRRVGIRISFKYVKNLSAVVPPEKVVNATSPSSRIEDKIVVDLGVFSGALSTTRRPPFPLP